MERRSCSPPAEGGAAKTAAVISSPALRLLACSIGTRVLSGAPTLAFHVLAPASPPRCRVPSRIEPFAATRADSQFSSHYRSHELCGDSAIDTVANNLDTGNALVLPE